jgi:long-chain acyl-CoA synthetase
MAREGGASRTDGATLPRPAMLLRPDVVRILRDIIRAEINAGAPGRYSDADAAAWTDATELGKPPAEVDSIELLGIAARVNQFFHIHESGIEDYLLADRRLGSWADIVVRARQDFDARFTFLTSGSTGVPKPCEHESAALQQEIQTLAARFADRKRIVSMVPTHHLYGFLFTVLLPAHLGVPVWDARLAGPGTLAREIRSDDLIVSFPTAWDVLRKALGGRSGVLRSAVGVCSTGACPPQVWAELLRMGLSELVEIYGSTETAGIASRTDPAAPMTLHNFWHAEAGDTQHAAALIRTMPDGSQRRFDCMDRLIFEDATRFRIAGRVDHAVKVGGINVFPSRVAGIIESHPRVAGCAVRLMREGEGERLKAFVVPRLAAAPEAGDAKLPEEDAEALRRELERWITGKLTPHEVPRKWTFGEKLPEGAMGKGADWE